MAGEPLLDDVSKQGLTVAGTRAWFNEQLAPDRQGRPDKETVMAGQRDCDSVVISGRLAKANEFFDAAEHLEDPRRAQRGR